MDYLTRDNMAKNNLQVLTSFDWDFTINFKNTIMYHPNIDIIRLRATAVNGISYELDHTPIEVNMRGFTIQQPGLTVNKPGALTLNLQDFEDQALRIWLIDWVNRCNSPANRMSARREDLMVDMTFWQLNSNRQRVFEYKYENCLPTGSSIDDSFSSEKNVNGKISLIVQAEYIKLTPLNI
jgi:hypothetical protein